MTEPALKFAGDKIVPLLLILAGGLAYWLKLPDAYCGAVSGAGLLAFQIDRKISLPQP